MEDETARQLLQSGTRRERLAAARHLLGRAQPADRHLIVTAANREDDQYVRAALVRLLVSLPSTHAPVGTGATDEAEAGDERSQIVRELTDQLTHEVATVAAALRHYAKREVKDFDVSETRRELDRLASVLDGLRQLGDAATPHVWEVVDIARLARSIISDEKVVRGYEALMHDGPDPHEVVGSEGLLSLFLRNAIVNGIEATMDFRADERPIVVAWGTDDREHWLAVLDQGPGPAGSLETYKATGASTKDGHAGMGLTIADQVANTLGGELVLAPQEGGGAICRLSWPRRGTDL